MPSPNPHQRTIIVGAGPVGSLAALLLSQHGIPIIILEANSTVDHRPRGIAYGASAREVFARAGILEDLLETGTTFQRLSWARLGGEVLAKLDVDEEHAGVALPVGDLTELILERLPEFVEVCWEHKVTGVGSDENEAWVDVQTPTGSTHRIYADFIIGADGASSLVRHSLFGRNFPGFTWSQQLIALNIHINFSEEHMPGDAQWIIDEQHWGMICRISTEKNFWRVVYGEQKGLSEEEMKDRMVGKLRRLLPNSPEPGEYEIVRFSPFVIHNRVAEKMAVGRVVLAGDAAHLCNPMGGLGLTSGVADVGALVDCLVGIYDGKASVEHILGKYDQVRRKVFTNIVDRTSTTNLKRMMRNADEVAAEDPFIRALAENDLEYLGKMQAAEMSIGRDMTQYYDLVAPAETTF